MRILSSGNDYDPPKAGNHAARLVTYCYLGSQDSPYGTKPKCWLSFELVNLSASNGEPPRVGRWYTASLHRQSALRPDIEALLGRPFSVTEANRFDVAKTLGMACFITIKNDEREGRVFTKIASITPVPDGLTVPPPTAKLLNYDFETDGRDIPEGLPDFIKMKIRESQEWKVPPRKNRDIVDDPRQEDEGDIPY